MFFVWLFTKRKQFFVQCLDQKDQILGKKPLKLALVKVIIMACLNHKDVASIRKSLAYSKLPNIEARYLVY